MVQGVFQKGATSTGTTSLDQGKRVLPVLKCTSSVLAGSLAPSMVHIVSALEP